MLLASEGVDLHFTEAAIHEVARVSEELNLMLQNIGARRWEWGEMPGDHSSEISFQKTAWLGMMMTSHVIKG